MKPRKRLYPYETKAVKALRRLLPKHRRVVAVGPTGSGKTVIGAAFIKVSREKRVLWIAHRVELLRQARRELVAAGIPEDDIGFLSGVEETNVGARILIASIDMLRRRPARQRELVVVDEAHRIMAKTYRQVLAINPGAQVLGLTATPWRLDGRALGKVFKHLHVIAEAAELISEGFLANPVVFGVTEERAAKIVKGIGVVQGDFNLRDAERHAMRYLLGDVVHECGRLAPHARTIVFATTRKHGKALTRRFWKAKRRTEYLDGDTPAELRQQILQRLETGRTEVVVNVDVLSEGFDCPPVKCIALARPTRSLTRYRQQCGRASRLWGRQRPCILDHTGNAWRFGMPFGAWPWSLEGRAGVVKGDAPIRRCQECGAVMPAHYTKCPECGEEQPKRFTRRQLIEQQAELERLRMKAVEQTKLRLVLQKIAKAKKKSRAWVEQTLGALA